jgi:hypothetical protein
MNGWNRSGSPPLAQQQEPASNQLWTLAAYLDNPFTAFDRSESRLRIYTSQEPNGDEIQSRRLLRRVVNGVRSCR